jgi:hypothetical protein
MHQEAMCNIFYEILKVRDIFCHPIDLCIISLGRPQIRCHSSLAVKTLLIAKVVWYRARHGVLLKGMRVKTIRRVYFLSCSLL